MPDVPVRKTFTFPIWFGKDPDSSVMDAVHDCYIYGANRWDVSIEYIVTSLNEWVAKKGNSHFYISVPFFIPFGAGDKIYNNVSYDHSDTPSFDCQCQLHSIKFLMDYNETSGGSPVVIEISIDSTDDEKIAYEIANHVKFHLTGSITTEKLTVTSLTIKNLNFTAHNKDTVIRFYESGK
jgi:hypothetical protein